MDPSLPGMPALSPAQHKLWSSHPDLAERAVAAVVAELGAIAGPEAMLAVAVQGTLEAAASFDSTRGIDYEQWALFYAVQRLWEWLRRASGADKEALARIREAMFRFLAHDSTFLDPWATRDTSRSALAAFSDGLLFGAVMARGTPRTAARGEDDLVTVEDAQVAGEALRAVVAGLRPEQIQLLERCHAYGETVKKAAQESGKGYRAVLREYHELLARMGERLAWLGVKEMPPWLPEVSGQIFHEPDPPSSGRSESG